MDCCELELDFLIGEEHLFPSFFPDTLTDGQTVQLDANNRPVLNYKGFVTQNVNGVWSILCDDKIDFDRMGPEVAGSVCVNLEMKGYRFFNKTQLSTRKLDITRRTRQSLKHFRNQFEIDQFKMREMRNQEKSEDSLQTIDEAFEPILGNEKDQCRALFVECIPHATVQQEDIIEIKDQSKILDLHSVVHPSQKPVVVVEPVKVVEESPVTVRYPWISEIHVNGQMKGIGILLGHHWVLTTSLCLEKVE